ncbi:MAG: methyltransferase domain-containing protein [Acidobacteriaceae bacterium]|nr:methyltransferase domain-containing protein [Acidobacteriaceae bacterium]MBV9754852.1 methyltransferase domain-containing protein [Hyphomicrobiales bacterium]
MLPSPETVLVQDRHAFVREYLARLPTPSTRGILFDIGAGSLPMGKDVEKAGYAWFGFDLDPQSPGVIQWDINTSFKGDQRADMVLLMDVLEHTYNPGIAMHNVVKILKPGGRIMMTMLKPRWSRARTMRLYSGYLA